MADRPPDSRSAQSDPADTRDPFFIPCPVCAESREVSETKKGKPYVHCDDCCVQVFERKERVIARLHKVSRRRKGETAYEVRRAKLDIQSSKPLRKARPGRPREPDKTLEKSLTAQDIFWE